MTHLIRTLSVCVCFFYSVRITVKLRKPWTPENFQECWLCTILRDPGAVSRVKEGAMKVFKYGRKSFRPYVKTFVAPFLSTRLTAPGSPRMVVYLPITIKFRTREQTSKPQTNYRCCLRFCYLALYWLIFRNTITFHEYFWCSRFCEFHSNRVSL